MTRKNDARSPLRTGAQHALALFLCLSSSQGIAYALDGGLDAALPLRDGGGSDASTSGGEGGGGATAGATAGDDPGGGRDAGGRDAGVVDAGAPDAGGGDNMSMDSSVPDVTAACSCESASGSGAREIHLCTGSFERDVCRSFSCEQGTLRSARCDEDSPVRLCCDMPARGLYTYLYEDCTHPNCETGFRAQCADFAGEVVQGLCETPDFPDDPNTEFDSTASCGIAQRSAGSNALWLLGSALTLVLTRRRRIRRAT